VAKTQNRGNREQKKPKSAKKKPTAPEATAAVFPAKKKPGSP